MTISKPYVISLPCRGVSSSPTHMRTRKDRTLPRPLPERESSPRSRSCLQASTSRDRLHILAPPTTMSELEEPWGQLISLQADHDERIPIVSSKFVIGRARGEAYIAIICAGNSKKHHVMLYHVDCDLPLPSNKFVSATHCTLERDPNNSLWLRDTR